MRAFGIVGIAIALVTQAAAAADPAAPVLTRRGPASVYNLVVPSFPDEVAKTGVALEVPLRLQVSEFGIVTASVAEGVSGAIERDIVAATRSWFVLPDVCRNERWTAAEVRTTLVFSVEGERRFISLKDPGWYAVGEDEILPSTAGSATASPPLKMREMNAPIFPRAVARRNIGHGVVVAVVEYDAEGRTVDVPRIYGWPRGLFEQSVREAVKWWQVDPDDEHLKRAGPGRYCMTVKFRLTNDGER